MSQKMIWVIFPQNDEFYAKMGEVMGELKTIREEHGFLVTRLPIKKTELKKLKIMLVYLRIRFLHILLFPF